MGQTEENIGRPPHSSVPGVPLSGITSILPLAEGLSSARMRGSLTGASSVASSRLVASKSVPPLGSPWRVRGVAAEPFQLTEPQAVAAVRLCVPAANLIAALPISH